MFKENGSSSLPFQLLFTKWKSDNYYLQNININIKKSLHYGTRPNNLTLIHKITQVLRPRTVKCAAIKHANKSVGKPGILKSASAG